MSFHDNYQKWQLMVDPRNCPVCKQEPMPEGMEDIVELANSWLSSERFECLPGACHLIAKKHVVELFEFTDTELLSLMKEVQLCAKALKEVTGAVKINYEIHGNTVPHFHIHLYPRYRDDPFPGQAIDYNQKKQWYTEEEYREYVSNLRAEIIKSMDRELP